MSRRTTRTSREPLPMNCSPCCNRSSATWAVLRTCGSMPLLLPALTGAGEQPPEEFREFGEDIKTDYSCPKCGYKWSGKAQ